VPGAEQSRFHAGSKSMSVTGAPRRFEAIEPKLDFSFEGKRHLDANLIFGSLVSRFRVLEVLEVVSKPRLVSGGFF
jgi:hypothetical protein